MSAALRVIRVEFKLLSKNQGRQLPPLLRPFCTSPDRRSRLPSHLPPFCRNLGRQWHPLSPPPPFYMNLVMLLHLLWPLVFRNQGMQ